MEAKLEVISDMLSQARELVGELETAETAEEASDVDAAVEEVTRLANRLLALASKCKRTKAA